VRAFVTGATGFIGGRVAAKLLERGWDVTVLARNPERAAGLYELGATLAAGDVTEPSTLTAPMRGADAVFHLAAWYALGVSDREGMEGANVGGTEHVLEAAAAANVSKVVYCSSVIALGAGRPGEIGDETRRHDGRFGSLYEETKWRAHEVARVRAASGEPVVTVMPGAVYGPGDTSIMGTLLRIYARRLLIAVPFGDASFSWVHVDDVADGVLLAADKGRDGEEYVLSGDNESVTGLLRRIAPLTRIRPPLWSIPQTVMRLARPLSPIVGAVLRQPSGIVRDGLQSMRGSLMFSSEKAQRELGYAYRPIEEGVVETVRSMRAA
jgi:dihydroflavonol-4-reductase